MNRILWINVAMVCCLFFAAREALAGGFGGGGGIGGGGGGGEWAGGGGGGGGHVGGGGGVVGDQRVGAAADHRHLAVALEAAPDPREFGERLGDRLVGRAHFAPHRDRRERIEHVVLAGQ